jgi:hypothetical protein
MSSHTTVHIEIHRVTTVSAKEPTYRNSNDRSPAKREDVQVVNLTARVEGVTEAALDRAINKAVAHLECERPVINESE